MSTLNPTYIPLSAGLSTKGGGPESERLEILIRGALRPLGRQNHIEAAINDLYALLSEVEAGEHEGNLSSATFSVGKRFLLAFPKTLPAPELSLDRDGEISFDWLGKHRKMFSVSLNSEGRVSFAGRLGLRRTVYGTEAFDDTVPEQVVESVKAIYTE